MASGNEVTNALVGLNESPSEKEGKFAARRSRSQSVLDASMKVPPKRKGNAVFTWHRDQLILCLNESPSEKEGK